MLLNRCAQRAVWALRVTSMIGLKGVEWKGVIAIPVE